MARVRREANAVGVPVMADESVLDHASLVRIIRMDAADLVKVKVMKQGGFLNTRRMIATAEAAGRGPLRRRPRASGAASTPWRKSCWPRPRRM